MNNIKKTSSMNGNGTSLQGYVVAKYEELVKTFGSPNDGPNAFYLDKTTCEWTIEYEENKFCTIYDYKIYTTPFDDYKWHIGGINEECVEILKKAIEEGKK